MGLGPAPGALPGVMPGIEPGAVPGGVPAGAPGGGLPGWLPATCGGGPPGCPGKAHVGGQVATAGAGALAGGAEVCCANAIHGMAESASMTAHLGVLFMFISLSLYQLLRIKVQQTIHLVPGAVLLEGLPTVALDPLMPPIWPLGGPLICDAPDGPSAPMPTAGAPEGAPIAMPEPPMLPARPLGGPPIPLTGPPMLPS